jgi:hypothetical protein
MVKTKSATAKRNAGYAKASVEARRLSSDNPSWRDGGSRRNTPKSIRKDVEAHRALVRSLSDSYDSYAGSSAASIRKLKEVTQKSRGGKITRRKSAK